MAKSWTLTQRMCGQFRALVMRSGLRWRNWNGERDDGCADVDIAGDDLGSAARSAQMGIRLRDAVRPPFAREQVRMNTSNPWGLSAREAELLDLWCIHGTRAAVCRVMRITTGTAGTFAERAASKMGVSHTTQALIQWDRFAFGRGKGST
jgi:DNA-binding CsgD family transcriptional regulator